MFELRDHPSFLIEATGKRLVVKKLGRQDLQRDRAFERPVSNASYTVAIPPRPSSATMRYEPSMTPGAIIVPDSSSGTSPGSPWSAFDKRQAGHNPDGEASGLSGAPQEGHDAELVKGSGPQPTTPRP